MIRHLYRLARQELHRATEPRRSSAWAALERSWLTESPHCAACGGSERAQVHHVQPYHLFPALELDRANLITLCMCDGLHCHLLVGHGANFRLWNPNVRQDAQAILLARSMGDAAQVATLENCARIAARRGP